MKTATAALGVSALLVAALPIPILANPAPASGAAAAAAVTTAAVTTATVTGGLRISENSIRGAVVRDSRGGSRGPSAAVLPDGRTLLGGGRDGTRLMIWDHRSGALRTIGRVISPSQRFDDARFAPTDIEVMSVARGRARLFISFPEYVRSRNCVRVAVNRVDISLSAAPAIVATKSVLRTKPCVRPNAIQHASGRLARINATQAYVTVGDLGSPSIAKRRSRGQLGHVLRIAEGKKAKKISQGHRNGQGLVLDSRGQLWETEHGPAGGDELNLIRTGRDYGWPFVTLGQAYGPGDYVRPSRARTHAGYTAPRTAWVPSVATSEIVQVPRSWAGWNSRVGGDFLMGTLKDESLWRVRVDSANRVIQRVRIPVGHRLRDLEAGPGGSVAVTTDSGLLLVVAPSRG